MYEDLRDRAIANLEKRKKKEKIVQVIGVILGSVAALLYGITFFMEVEDRPYMFIPIGILAFVFCIIYTVMLGLPFAERNDITEDDVEEEIAKIYRRYRLSELDNVNEEEEFELRQIEKLIDDKEDYV